jgi:TRAP-type C4-dicarboxylate transport system permease small subunit
MGGRFRFLVEIFNRVVVLLVGVCVAIYGAQNFMTGFGSFRMPSMLPIAYLYFPIPICAVLIVLFNSEQIINSVRNGFARVQDPADAGF